ncbi:hypothetical protein CC86DRAFT_437031 [Ophiobolus disseminans]|uniref:DUF3176 domain-containing protein n=1 Tax=Ophiobolus disseminans TaxID=1469910 RepID=A0A6A7A971_9PLEO|nr:hypothetical protein CC86DRAFT_437031 [Ophiobolus disseminans]
MAVARSGTHTTLPHHNGANPVNRTPSGPWVQGATQNGAVSPVAGQPSANQISPSPTRPNVPSVTAVGPPPSNNLQPNPTTSTPNTTAAVSSTSQTNVVALGPPSAQRPTPPIPPILPTPPRIQPMNVQSASNNANTSTSLPPPPLLKHRFRRTISRWNDWWLLEITAGLLSIICLTAIVAILAHYDGKPLSKWHSGITPNAIISVLATVSKSSILLPVAECISQLIWLRFQTPHTLQLIQEFDEASRGALGSFQILFSTEAAAAWFGAIITLTALAFEPFAQQVLSLESREVLLDNKNTSVPVSTVFNTGKTNPVSFPVNYYPLGDLAHALDPSIRAAGFDGIYSNTISPPYKCGASKCRFGDFTSLAICSSCTDVLQELKGGCTPAERCGSSQTYTTPANLSMQTTYSMTFASGRVLFATLFNSSAKTASKDFDMPTVAKFATLKLNKTDTGLVPLRAYDCSLRLCIKSWASASFQDSSFQEAPPKVIEFQKVTHRNPGQKPFSILEIDPALNATRFGTYYINWYDWNMMATFLAAQFTYRGRDQPSETDDQGVPIMLYRTSDMPAMINKLADSLTNMIRVSGDSYIVKGQAFREEIFINIQWPWISLPVLVVLSANILLVIMILQTWRRRAPVWKSSVLALLLHGIKASRMDTGGAGISLLSEMELLAERRRVKLKGSGMQDLKFVGV